MAKERPNNAAIPWFEFKINDEPVSLYPINMRDMTLHESISGRSSNVYFKFYDKKWGQLEKMFVDGAFNFRFRYGYSERLSQWKNYVVTQYDVTYTIDGSFIEIWGVDRAVLGRTAVSYSYGNRSISQIVREICTINKDKWKYSIEETAGNFQLRQNNISDIHFIKSSLLSRAVSKDSGRGNFRLFFRNGDELNFRTPNYSLGSYKTYNIHRDAQHANMFFRYRVKPLSTFKRGGCCIVVEGYDPINKKTLPIRLDNTSGTTEKVLLGSKIPQYNFTGGDGRYQHVAFNSYSEVEGYAKQIWYLANMSNINGFFRMIPDPLLEPGRLITIALLDDYTSRWTNGSGLYLVEDIITYFNAKSKKYDAFLILSKNSMELGNVEPVGTQIKPTSKIKVVETEESGGTEGSSKKFESDQVIYKTAIET